ncbi:hypothetical protein HY639_04075 [Candidatus Woesearchaeota archaeon]|nr:hypothetical protein [Candidatus Woesearchaeota archaeon]
MKPMGSLDLDGVLCSFLPSFLDEVNRNYPFTLREEDVVDYDFTLLGLKDEQIKHVYKKMFEKEAYLHMLPIDGSSFVDTLTQAYELMIVTARPPVLQAQTNAWVNNNFPLLFHRVLYGEDKHQLVKEHHCVFHVDDYPDHIHAMVGSTTLPVLFSRRSNTGYVTQFTYGDNTLDGVLDYYAAHNGFPSVRVNNWADCCSLLLQFSQSKAVSLLSSALRVQP